MKKKLILLLALLMVMSLFLAACGTDEDPVDEDENGEAVEDENGEDDEGDDEEEQATGERGGTLKFGAHETAGEFNPIYYNTAYDNYVVQLVFSSLLTKDPDDEWIPEIAMDFPEISDDGRVITYTLKEDIVFSDGEPLTAEDVVFTFQAIADPSYVGRFGSVVEGIEGYRAYRDGEDEDGFGVVALDDYTVEFTFAEALRTNLSNTASTGILPKHYYGPNSSYGDVHDGIVALNAAPLGAGPYVLEQYRPAQDVILERNENYMHEDYYMIETIEYLFTTSDTEMEDFEAGMVHLVETQIDPDNIERAMDMPGVNINAYPRNAYGYVKTNHESGPTAELEVRQALFHAMPFQEFVDGHFRGFAEVQYHPFLPAAFHLEEDFVANLTSYDYDLDRAREILDDAGWVVGDSGYRERDGEVLELRFMALAIDNHPLDSLIPLWTRDWGEALNINLNIAYEDFNSLVETVINEADANVDEWHMFFLATSSVSSDPHTSVDQFNSERIGNAGNNTSRYRNDRVDELIAEGERAMTQEEAIPLYQELTQILVDDAVLMPMYVNTTHDFYYDHIKNFNTDPVYPWYRALRHAWIEE